MAHRRPRQFGVAKLHGTTSLVLNADGTVHSEARHYPYGEERWSSGTVPTDYRFTGQRIDSWIKLLPYGRVGPGQRDCFRC